MKTYALIGKSLTHSFSYSYFQEKYRAEKINNCRYINIEINNISLIHQIVENNKISGFNVTSPYKEEIIPYLHKITDTAKKIGAVNTVMVINDKLHGFNTDIIGFKKSITPILKKRKSSLILGSGGASKAIQFVFNNLNINFKVVSRSSKFTYSDISQEVIKNNEIIINCTPVGAYPNHNNLPPIPYKFLNSKHLLFDLVYNPSQTEFLSCGLKYNTDIKNGLEMLRIQAEESWKIWNSNII